jgi:hypothetical protein
MIYAPYPMSTYHGNNQLQGDTPYSGTYRVYEPGVYDAAVQIRVIASLEPNERLEVSGNFSHDEVAAGSIFMNLVDDDLDMYGGATQTISLGSGLYNVTINGIYYLDDVPQEDRYVNFFLHQPIPSILIPELTDWSTFRFFLEAGCFFLVLAGLCIGEKGEKDKLPGENHSDVSPLWDID